MSNDTPAADTYEKVTISLPTSVLQTIDRLAAADRRTRSNFIVCAIDGLLNPPTEPAAPTPTAAGR